MVQCNVFQDLKPTLRTSQRYAGRVIEQALRLQRISQSAPWLAQRMVVLIWWENDGVVGSAHIEAEALSHCAAAHQDLGDTASAQICYEQALRIVESSGLGQTEVAARVHNFLSTFYQHLAAPRMRLLALPGARRKAHMSKFEWAPNASDTQAAQNMNSALRHSLTFLRLCQRIHGMGRHETGMAHQGVADICFTARARKPAEYHSAAAVRILTGVFGRDHHFTESAEGLRGMIATANPTDVAMPLDDDVVAELSRNAAMIVCGRLGCGKIEGKDHARFQQCSRCLIQRYCSRECQKLDWHKHKSYCARATPMAESQLQDKAYQKVMNKKDALQQEKFASERDAEASPVAFVKVLTCLACAATCDNPTHCECGLAVYCSETCRESHVPKHSRHCVLRLRQKRHEQSVAAQALLAQQEAEAAKQREAWAAGEPERNARAQAQRDEKARMAREKEEMEVLGSIIRAWHKIARSQVIARAQASAASRAC